MASHEVVTTLVTALHTNIDSIHATLQSLSSHPTHEAELQRLAAEREAKIFDLRTAHAQALQVLANQRLKEQDELEAQRQKEAEELEEQRKKEWEEILKKRAREDEERKERIRKQEEERERSNREEDECRETEREQRELKLAEDIEKELERVEDEIEAKVEEGKKALRELDEKRRAINAEIDKALNMPTVIPKIKYRSRTRTLSRAGTMELGNLAEHTTEASVVPAESKEVKTPEPGAWLGKGASKEDIVGTRELVDPHDVAKMDEAFSKPGDVFVDGNNGEGGTRDLANILIPKSPKSTDESAPPILATPNRDEETRDLSNRNFETENTSEDLFQEPDRTSNKNLSTETPIVSQTKELPSNSNTEDDIEWVENSIASKEELLNKEQSHEVTQKSLQLATLAEDADKSPHPEDELSEGTLVDDQPQSTSTDAHLASTEPKDLNADNDLSISAPDLDKFQGTPHRSIESDILANLKNKSVDSTSTGEKSNGDAMKDDDSDLENTDPLWSSFKRLAEQSTFPSVEKDNTSNGTSPVNSSLDLLPERKDPSGLVGKSTIDIPASSALASEEDRSTGIQEVNGNEAREAGDEVHDTTESPKELNEARDISRDEGPSAVRGGNETQQDEPLTKDENPAMENPAKALESEDEHLPGLIADVHPSVSENLDTKTENTQDRDLVDDSGSQSDESLDKDHQLPPVEIQPTAVDEQKSQVDDDQELPEEHHEIDRAAKQALDSENLVLQDVGGMEDTTSSNSKNITIEPGHLSPEETQSQETAALPIDPEDHDEPEFNSPVDISESPSPQPEAINRSMDLKPSNSSLRDLSIGQANSELVTKYSNEVVSPSLPEESQGVVSVSLSHDVQGNETASEVLPKKAPVEEIVPTSDIRETPDSPEIDDKSFEDMYPELQIRNLDAVANHKQSQPKPSDNEESQESHLDQNIRTEETSSTLSQTGLKVQGDTEDGKDSVDEGQIKPLDQSTNAGTKNSEHDLEAKQVDIGGDPSGNEAENLSSSPDKKDSEVQVPVTADIDTASRGDENPIKTTAQDEIPWAVSSPESPITLNDQSLQGDERNAEHDEKNAASSAEEQLNISSTHDQNGTIDVLPRRTTSETDSAENERLGNDERALSPSKGEISVVKESHGDSHTAEEVESDDNSSPVKSTEDKESARVAENDRENTAVWESNNRSIEHTREPESHLNNSVLINQALDHEASDTKVLVQPPTSLDPTQDGPEPLVSEGPEATSEALNTQQIPEPLDSPTIVTSGEGMAAAKEINLGGPNENVDSAPLGQTSEYQSFEDRPLSPLRKDTPETGSALESTQMTPVASSDNLIRNELESQEMMLLGNGTEIAKDGKDTQLSDDDFSREPTTRSTSEAPENVSSKTLLNGTQDSHEAAVPNVRTELPSNEPAEVPNEALQHQTNGIDDNTEEQFKSQDVPSAGLGTWPQWTSRDLIIDHDEDHQSTDDDQYHSVEDQNTGWSQADDDDHRHAALRESSSNSLSSPEHTVASTRDVETEQHQSTPNQYKDGEPWPLRDVQHQATVNGADIHEQDDHDDDHAHDGGSENSDNWSESRDETEDEDEETEPEQRFGSLRPNTVHRMTNEDEYLPRSARNIPATDVDSEDMSFEEKYGVPRSTTPIRSLSRIENHHESPHTVQDADDLFDEDDSEDDSQSERDPRDSYPEDLADQYFQRAETPLEVVPEHEPLTEFNDTYASHRSSGLFANLVDTVRSDIPAVRQAQLDNYQPALEYSLGNATRPRAVSFEEDEREYASRDAPQYESSLHVRTHTADTVPSFESYAQSDSIPTTPSETSSSPFMDNPHNDPVIRDSGRERGMTESSQPPHDLIAEPAKEVTFDPAFVNAYPSLVSPKTSYVDLNEETRDRSGAGYGSFGAQTGLEAHRAEISPIKGVESGAFAVPSSVETTKVPTVASEPFQTSPNGQRSPSYDSNKTPTTESPFQATKSLPRTPPRLSINSQSSPSPIVLSGSPSSSPGLSKRPPPQVPTGSPGSLFAKTRSVFELASPQGSPALAPSPITALSAIRHNSPPPPPPPRRSIGSRPSSLQISEPVNYDPPQEKGKVKELKEEIEEEEFMPRSLDGNNKPPSPVFNPSRSGSISSLRKEDDDPLIKKRNSNPFLGTLSRLVGGVQGQGLEDSVHNPAREPLLKRADEY
ncbi:hypothetical protein DL95DRAFT_447168 [Leptodontidium sp. 2 PMI_412]|nr:hypothetical protein DL95DRAFT_447168 [Leptodontidium sp. 2 PMI_412]